MSIPPGAPPLADAAALVAAVDDPTLTTAHATAALTAASAIIRSETRQELTRHDADELKVSPEGSSVILLPELPVRGLGSVSVDGQLLASGDYQWSERGVLRAKRGFAWPRDLDTVHVVYDHGYLTVPGDLEWLALSLGARLLENVGEQVQQTVMGTFQLMYRAPGWTAIERAILARYRPW